RWPAPFGVADPSAGTPTEPGRQSRRPAGKWTSVHDRSARHPREPGRAAFAAYGPRWGGLAGRAGRAGGRRGRRGTHERQAGRTPTEMTGWTGGWAPREPEKGRLEKSNT